MAGGYGSISSPFQVQLSQDSKAVETLTTSGLPRGGILRFVAIGQEVAADAVATMPLIQKVPADGGPAVPVVGGGPLNINSAAQGSVQLVGIDVPNATFAPGDQLRIEVAGGTGAQVRVFFTFIASDARFLTVIAS